MSVFKMMLQFDVQAQIAYVEAESAKEAEQKCRARYDGQRYAAVRDVTYFSGPHYGPGVYADIR